MPAFGGTVLKDEEIWDIVNYVLSIPFEGQPAKPLVPSDREHMASSVPARD